MKPVTDLTREHEITNQRADKPRAENDRQAIERGENEGMRVPQRPTPDTLKKRKATDDKQ